MNCIQRAFAVAAIGAATGAFAAPLPGGTLDPLSIPKYVEPLVIPPLMPNQVDASTGAAIPNAYDVAVRQFSSRTSSRSTRRSTGPTRPWPASTAR
jgi:hypothetical protein